MSAVKIQQQHDLYDVRGKEAYDLVEEGGQYIQPTPDVVAMGIEGHAESQDVEQQWEEGLCQEKNGGRGRKVQEEQQR